MVFETDQARKVDQVFTYALVTPDGQLSLESGTFQQMRGRTFDGHQGANELIDLPVIYPVMAYCAIAYEQPDPRRMNKVANGMVWELTARPGTSRLEPDRDDLMDAYVGAAPIRVVKMRGTVVFYERIRSLTDEQVEELRQAHETAFGKLRARGWI